MPSTIITLETNPPRFTQKHREFKIRPVEGEPRLYVICESWKHDGTIIEATSRPEAYAEAAALIYECPNPLKT